MTPRPSASAIEAALQDLFGLLPAHLRSTDAANGRALEALFQILAEGDAEIDAAITALFDNQFIETADPGTLGHFAALTDTPRLTPLPHRSGLSERAFIANAVRTNRGKGTARTLEQLAADVTGFGAVAVEYFQRLAKLQHALDFDLPRPGTARLTPGETAARAGRAFDPLPRVSEVRAIDTAAGRWGLGNVGVHVVRFATATWPAPAGPQISPERLAAVPEAGAWAPGGAAQAGYFQLAAQGEERLCLFNPDRRDMGRFARPDMTDLPDRLRRLPLHLETEARRHAALEGRPFTPAEEPWFGSDGDPFTIYLRREGETHFTPVPPPEIRIANLEAAPSPAGYRPPPARSHSWFTPGDPAPLTHSADHAIACAFDPVTGRLIVAEPEPGQPEVTEVRIAHSTARGALAWGGPYERGAADVPFELVDTAHETHFIRIVDRLAVPAGPPAARRRSVPTLEQALAEWADHGAGHTCWIVLTRCDRERPSGGASAFEVTLHPDSTLNIVAAQWREHVEVPGGPPFDPARAGFLLRRERCAILEAPVVLSAASAPQDEERAGSCLFDGLELTGGLALRKDAFTRLDLRHCTVRNPGGAAISTSAPLVGTQIAVTHSRLGPCRLDFGSQSAQGQLALADSLLFADGASEPVLAARSCAVEMHGVTVLGEAHVRSLEATNALFTQPVHCTRRQAGCLRYSHVPPGSTTPRRFRCQPDLALARRAEAKGAPLTATERDAEILGARPLFLDTEADAPGLAMLHALCPDAVALGGEGEAEMGAFSRTASRLRLRNMAALFDRSVPFATRAALLDDTQSRLSAEQGHRP